MGLGLNDLQVTKPIQFHTNDKITKIKCGYFNTLLLTEGFEVLATGLNNHNQVSELN